MHPNVRNCLIFFSIFAQFELKGAQLSSTGRSRVRGRATFRPIPRNPRLVMLNHAPKSIHQTNTNHEHEPSMQVSLLSTPRKSLALLSWGNGRPEQGLVFVNMLKPGEPHVTPLTPPGAIIMSLITILCLDILNISDQFHYLGIATTPKIAVNILLSRANRFSPNAMYQLRNRR
jgi:hypothetical protein